MAVAVAVAVAAHGISPTAQYPIYIIIHFLSILITLSLKTINFYATTILEQKNFYTV